MKLFNKIFPPKADPSRAEKRNEGKKEDISEKAVKQDNDSRNIRDNSGGIREKNEKGDYRPGVLLAPHVTEKTTSGNTLNKYVFRVANTANKPEIKKAVEGKYGVAVSSVNILNTKPKAVRLGRIEGVRPGYKKAIVTLIQGDKIEVSV